MPNAIDPINSAVLPSPHEGFAAAMNWQSAMDPGNVASLVWDAIVNDTFYILPHPGFDEIVKDRVDRILSRSAPAQLDFADLARRREAGELV